MATKRKLTKPHGVKIAQEHPTLNIPSQETTTSDSCKNGETYTSGYCHVEAIRDGWICPLCKKGISPDLKVCPCHVTVPPYEITWTPNPWPYVVYPGTTVPSQPWTVITTTNGEPGSTYQAYDGTIATPPRKMSFEELGVPEARVEGTAQTMGLELAKGEGEGLRKATKDRLGKKKSKPLQVYVPTNGEGYRKRGSTQQA